MSEVAPSRPLPVTARSRGFRVRLWATILAALALSASVTGTAAASGQVASASAAAEADTTVSWSARPADTTQGSGRPNFAYEMLPGATLSDGILVTNRGEDTLKLEVYAADGFLTADGSLDILPSGKESTELGSWIDLPTQSITLAAGQSTEVPFEVRVPAAAQPGDYSAGVVAAMSVESGGVVTERRLGSRVHLRVAGDLAPAMTITDVRLDYHGTAGPIDAGAATLTFTLTNTGNARVAPSGAIAVAGPFGLAAVSTGLGDVPELLPGSSLERSIRVDGVAPLLLATADLRVDADVVQRPGSPTTDVPAVASATASTTAWAVPWTGLALIALIAAVLLVWALSRRRAKAKQRHAVEAAVAEALAQRDAVPVAAEEPEAAGSTDAASPGSTEGGDRTADERADAPV